MVGRPAAALSQYREMERLLKEGLGAAPSAASLELVAPLVEGNRNSVPLVDTPVQVAAPLQSIATPPAPPAAPAPPPAAPQVRSTLPLTLTRFFGREEEMTRLLFLL